MPRRFNVTGACKPELHYMLPAAARVPQARRLVADAGARIRTALNMWAQAAPPPS